MKKIVIWFLALFTLSAFSQRYDVEPIQTVIDEKYYEEKEKEKELKDLYWDEFIDDYYELSLRESSHKWKWYGNERKIERLNKERSEKIEKAWRSFIQSKERMNRREEELEIERHNDAIYRMQQMQQMHQRRQG